MTGYCTAMPENPPPEFRRLPTNYRWSHRVYRAGWPGVWHILAWTQPHLRETHVGAGGSP